ncbi:MAG: hypothetical protein EOM40_04060 [Clostridia bacterium]|nr:hypothetical protein [Clostridia bacterium]
MDIKWDKLGLFAGGIVFGTAGVKALSSKDAKKAYTHTVAAALRVKECVMTVVTKVKENSDDILADAKEINEKRAEKEACEINDTAKEAEESFKEAEEVLSEEA